IRLPAGVRIAVFRKPLSQRLFEFRILGRHSWLITKAVPKKKMSAPDHSVILNQVDVIHRRASERKKQTPRNPLLPMAIVTQQHTTLRDAVADRDLTVAQQDIIDRSGHPARNGCASYMRPLNANRTRSEAEQLNPSRLKNRPFL